jgi:hypothetical protein
MRSKAFKRKERKETPQRTLRLAVEFPVAKSRFLVAVLLGMTMWGDFFAGRAAQRALRLKAFNAKSAKKSLRGR